MPTYGYECKECKEQFETVQKITADPLTVHDGCGGELRRLLYPVGIVFKGSGFYVNDYAKSGSKESGSAKSDSTSSNGSESKSETKADASAEKTTESKSSDASASAPATAASTK